MAVRVDAAGNLVGHLPGSRRRTPGRCCSARTSTRCATRARSTGRSACCCAIACVARLRAEERRRCRSRSTCSGSPTRRACGSGPPTSAAARSRGRSTPRCSTSRDDDGVTVRGRRSAAIRRCRPARAAASGCSATARSTSSRGRCWRSATLPVGVVTGDRGRDARRGPLHGARRPRRDRPDGAAPRRRAAPSPSWSWRSRRAARSADGLVATVGRLDGAPGRAERRPGGGVGLARRPPRRRRGPRRPRSRDPRPRGGDRGGARRRARPGTTGSTTAAVAMDPALSERLAAAVRPRRASSRCGSPSGAGHDAVALAALTPVAMLFVRCAGGVCHHPDESVDVADVAVALDVLDRFVRGLAAMSADLSSARRLRRPADVGDRRRQDRARSARSCPAAARRSTPRGLVVLPGVVDAHVHLNDPGRADWEGFATGTAALAAGGTTLRRHAAQRASRRRSTAPASTRSSRRRRRRAASTSRCGAGSCRATLDRLDELAARGVVGFKAFMSASGMAEFAARRRPHAATRAWRARRALGLPVAVHAESDVITAALAARAVGPTGGVGVRDYLASRPVVAELEAIGRAILLAGETGCALHVVHVSTGARRRARRRGAGARRRRDVRDLPALPRCSTRTTPSGSARSRSARRRCGRPRSARRCGRARDRRHRRWSPATTRRRRPTLKRGDDLFAIWGGISGCQTLRAATLAAAGVAGRRGWRELLGGRAGPALRARDRKGALEVGRRRRPVVLVDRTRSVRLGRDDLRYRHRQSPFAGRTLRGRVVRTLLRGRTIALRRARRPASPRGRILRRRPRPRTRAESAARAAAPYAPSRVGGRGTSRHAGPLPALARRGPAATRRSRRRGSRR